MFSSSSLPSLRNLIVPRPLLFTFLLHTASSQRAPAIRSVTESRKIYRIESAAAPCLSPLVSQSLSLNAKREKKERRQKRHKNPPVSLISGARRVFCFSAFNPNFAFHPASNAAYAALECPWNSRFSPSLRCRLSLLFCRKPASCRFSLTPGEDYSTSSAFWIDGWVAMILRTPNGKANAIFSMPSLYSSTMPSPKAAWRT